jgi:2-oxoglutarate/2-oxoacid ferredoxin oxidoreductase subunit alpha
VLLPGSVEECFEFGWRSFDISDELQTPVFVLSDLDLGMNNWMSEPFEYPAEPIKRGKVLDREKLEAFIEKYETWGRYLDVDGDGVAYRTLPGTDHPHAAYFTRGTGHNDMATYSERADDWVQNMERLRRKFELAREKLPAPIIEQDPNKKIGIITFGTNEPAVLEARDWLAKEGIETNYLRIRGLPIAESVREFIHSHDRIYVPENNFDGQMSQILCLENPEDVTHITSLPLGDSLPMTPRWVYNMIMEKERN